MSRARQSTGLSDEDIINSKVFMRTFVDALSCAEDIAQKDASRAHYKDQIKILMRNIRWGKIIVDNDGEVLCS